MIDRLREKWGGGSSYGFLHVDLYQVQIYYLWTNNQMTARDEVTWTSFINWMFDRWAALYPLYVLASAQALRLALRECIHMMYWSVSVCQSSKLESRDQYRSYYFLSQLIETNDYDPYIQWNNLFQYCCGVCSNHSNPRITIHTRIKKNGWASEMGSQCHGWLSNENY